MTNDVPMPQVKPPAPEPNFVLSGDEARVLMQSLMSKGMTYDGPSLGLVTNLLLRLQAISINQPPQNGENNDRE